MFRVVITTQVGDVLKLSNVEEWRIRESGVLEIIFQDRKAIFYYSPYFWRYFSVMGASDEMEEEIEEDSAGGSTRV